MTSAFFSAGTTFKSLITREVHTFLKGLMYGRPSQIHPQKEGGGFSTFDLSKVLTFRVFDDLNVLEALKKAYVIYGQPSKRELKLNKVHIDQEPSSKFGRHKGHGHFYYKCEHPILLNYHKCVSGSTSSGSWRTAAT